MKINASLLLKSLQVLVFSIAAISVGISFFLVLVLCFNMVHCNRKTIIGTLSKPRRQRQRERHKTKGLMSRTIAAHVRYNSWYIS